MARTPEAFAEWDVVARTLWGEARGEPDRGMEAVLRVIMNRARDRSKRWPDTLKGVCLQRFQFSMWNEGDPNKDAACRISRNNPHMVRAIGVIYRVLKDDPADLTLGANHYFNPDVVRPSWAREMEHTVTIGRHAFYRG